MYPEKKIHRQLFNGGMNSDLSRKIMPPNVARYFLNCRVNSTAGGNVGVVTNVKGNTLITTPLPAGLNISLGYAEDPERNKFYFAVYNDNGYHTWYVYDDIKVSVSVVFQSRTDSNGVDILRWDPLYMILHADVIQGDKLYWVNGGLGKACKLNINKAMDKSDAGYGLIVYEEYINAYKKAPTFPPSVGYITDVTRSANFVYGQLQKFAYRYIYDDGEISHVSEFSAVPTPPKESYLGAKNISYDNNCIEVKLDTGPANVKKLELLLLVGSGLWQSIDTIEKEKYNLADNSTYVYNFYNDGSYTAISQEKVIKPYSFLPRNPRCQSFVKTAMTYTGFKEGFPVVRIEGAAVYTDEELFIPSGTQNELNSPTITITEVLVDHDGALFGGRTNIKSHFIVGHDVKAGNVFKIFGQNGDTDNYYFEYTATQSDSAVSIANRLKSNLRGIGRGIPDGNNGITNESTDGAGNVSFDYFYLGKWKENKIRWSGSVKAVSVSSLQDNGVSVNKIKSGSDRKYGIVFEDEDGRKSLTYTNDDFLVKTPFITEVGGIKRPIHLITLASRPPVWARYYHLVRTNDYTNFIQLLIQQVIDVAPDPDTPGAFVDLVVGSLFTYQKMHENTVLQYTFEKGDRLRLIKDTAGSNYYPFFETEILSYHLNTTETINANIVVNGTINVKPEDGPKEQYIGKSIQINNTERVILSIAEDHYVLDYPLAIGTTDDPVTSPGYILVDRRGIVRIKKPLNIEVKDLSTVELLKPQRSVNDEYKRFYDFGYKFEIADWGTDKRAFRGNIQDQDGTDDTTISATPAILKVIEGDSYVRNRELPTNNIVPDTQVQVEEIEDPSYSDFYESNLHSIGRVYPQDDGSGEKYFGSRTRFSNNYIEDTKINGLNDFDNLDRKDYNDPYGDAMLTKFRENRLHIFKALRNAWVPVLQSIFEDAKGQQVVGLSSDLLGEMQYSSWEGGIGDYPASWFSNGNFMYLGSENSGVFLRMGGDGSDPISSMYGFDTESREFLRTVQKNKLRLIGGFDRENDEAIWSYPPFQKILYAGGFNQAEWKLLGDPLPDGTIYYIITAPTHGDVVTDENGNFVYTPDAGYVGSDSFIYGAKSADETIVYPQVKKCISVVQPANRVKSWRQKPSSSFCVTTGEPPVNNGKQGWYVLEEYYADDETLTGRIMPNIKRISSQAIVPSTATITIKNDNSAPIGGINGDIFFNSFYDYLYKKIAGIWVLLTDRSANDNYIDLVDNDIACPIPDPPDPPEINVTVYNHSDSVSVTVGSGLEGPHTYSFGAIAPGGQKLLHAIPDEYTVRVKTGAGGLRYIYCTGQDVQSGGPGYVAIFEHVNTPILITIEDEPIPGG